MGTNKRFYELINRNLTSKLLSLLAAKYRLVFQANVLFYTLGYFVAIGQSPLGPNSGSSFTNVARGGSTTAWTNLGNGGASDDSYVNTVSSLTSNGNYTDYYTIEDFGFSVPGTASIDSIIVATEYSKTGDRNSSEDQFRIIKGGSIVAFDNKIGAPWPTADASRDHGFTVLGHDPLWGSTWTPTDINAADFGVAISVKSTGGGTSVDPRIDHIEISVYYTNPLPIELVSFKGRQREDAVELIWETASELNNDHFTMEKSIDADADEFFEIGRVPGVGNSLKTQFYRFIDIEPHNLNYYRLRQTDFDGTWMLSSVISVEFDLKKIHSIFYPNPFDSKGAFLKIHNPDREILEVKFYDLNKKEVWSIETKENRIYIETSKFKKGLYTYHLLKNGISIDSGKILKIE